MKSLISVAAVSVTVALLLSAQVSAEDHLLPEESLFTGIYYEKAFSLLSSRLGRMHGPEAFANAVVLPSFGRSYVIVFERSRTDTYKLVCMQTEQSMAAYQILEDLKSGRLLLDDEERTKEEIMRLESELPKDYMDVEAAVVELDIDNELGRELYTVWGKMLYETHYQKPKELTPESLATFGMGNTDGTTYHFSFFHGGTPLSGWAWGFPADGRVAKLVALTTASREACDSSAPNVNAILSEKVHNLADALNEKPL